MPASAFNGITARCCNDLIWNGMKMTLIRLLALGLLALLTLVPAVFAQSASALFGSVHQPTGGVAMPIGSYAKGCIAGAVQLSADGPGWQAMRLSRDRRWGSAELVEYIEALAQVVGQDGLRGILVGDMGQARGGPMASGHASHQIGLDVDIWLQPMPDHVLSAEERERISAISVLKAGTREVDSRQFGETQRLLIYRAAELPGVARIFVAPGIKRSLCAINWRDRSFLSKIRPWYGHDDHFHVRLSCPAGAQSCVDQNPVPAGDGCGSDLDYWFTDAPYRASTSPPSPPLTLADLPKSCTAVVKAR